MQEKKSSNPLLQKYLDGSAEPAERNVVNQWLVQLGLRNAADSVRAGAYRQRSALALRKRLQPGQNTKIMGMPVRIAAAASIVLAVVAGIWWYRTYTTRYGTTAQVTYTELRTSAGQMKTVQLPDGSRIVLNNASRLSYPSAFDQQRREVYLSGEAFFEIQHDANRPFRVHAGRSTVQVLGTSFNISAYPHDASLTVGVATGKVGVITDKPKTYLLTPGQLLAISVKSNQVKQTQTSIAAMSAWQQGTLIFKNEKLENIARRLERFYKISIQFNDAALRSKEISLTARNQSLLAVLKALSVPGEFSYRVSGNRVVIW